MNKPSLSSVLTFILMLIPLEGCNETPAPKNSGSGYPDGICGPADPATGGPPERLVVITEKHGSGGGVTVIDIDTMETRINVALTHDDATARWYDEKIWIINRFGADNITILDGSDFSLLKQFSVKIDANTPCNPHDIAFLDRCKLYVTCHEQPFMLIVNPQEDVGHEIIGHVDLSSLADDDGIPEMSHMKATDDGVWVTIGRMRRNHGWIPDENAYLALIDIHTDTLVDTILLEGTNPLGPIRAFDNGRKLVVSTAGDWSGHNAGLEVVDTVSGEASIALSSTELEGIVSAFTLDDSLCGHAVITAPTSFETAVNRFCLEPANVTPCISRNTLLATDVAVTSSAQLIVTDRASHPAGVRFYNAIDCAPINADPISTGFPPGFTTPLLLIPKSTKP